MSDVVNEPGERVRAAAITAANREIYGAENPPLDAEQRRTVRRIVDAVLEAAADELLKASVRPLTGRR